MKILSTGDWHLDRMTAGFDRYYDIKKAIDETVRVAIEEQIDLYVFNGDLANPNNIRSHRAVGTALAVANELMHEGIYSLWITGNHDVIEDGSVNDEGEFYSVLSPLAAAGYKVSSLPLRKKYSSPISASAFEVITLPFPASSHIYDPEDVIKSLVESGKKIKDPVLIIGHLSMNGAKLGSESVDMTRGRSIEWPVATIKNYIPNAIMIGGHYHKQQEYNGVTFAGSLARLGFDEEDNSPGYLIVEV